ncbi:MAG: 30S ribosomal protein S6 [Acidobacteriota bacterium]
MRHYETVVVLPPNLGETDLEAQVTLVEKDLKERFGGQNLVVNRWGKRTLAYPIRKFTEGYYVLYEYDSEAEDCVAGVEGRLRLNESVMRYLTIRRDEEVRSEAKLKARSAKRRRHAGEEDLDVGDSYAEDDQDME